MDKLKNIFYKVDWPLLLFLVGVTYVKLYVKLAAVVLYFGYVLLKNYKLSLPNRLQWFYALIMMLAVGTAVSGGDLSNADYRFAFMLGMLQWGISMLASYLVFISIRGRDNVYILTLFKAFFALNAIISFGSLLYIILTTGTFPYWTDSFKYGVSTGDYIRGVFSDSSVANAAVNALGVLFFLRHMQYRWAVLCLVVMMLCTSNITVLLLLLSLVMILFFYKHIAKKPVSRLLLITIIAYPAISWQNMNYIKLMVERGAEANFQMGLDQGQQIQGDTQQSTVKAQEGRDLYSPYYNSLRSGDLNSLMKSNSYYANRIPLDKPLFGSKEFFLNIDKYRARIKGRKTSVAGELDYIKTSDRDYGQYGYVLDPDYLRNGRMAWYDDSISFHELERSAMPGKLYTHLQTWYFNRTNYRSMLLGAGLGRFSSKLAIKATGLGLQGTYPKDKEYMSTPFAQYHFHTLLYYLSLHAGAHSISNMPNSVYNQLMGEYGLSGLIIFIVFYLGFFIAKRKKIRALLPLLLLLLLLFEIEYWFEVLSLTVIFELMIFSEVYARTEHE